MKGWLVYDDEGAKRNGWFIQKLQAELAALGLVADLKIVEKVEELYDKILPDFAVIRTINPALNLFFEEKKIPVFNGALTAKIACDKWQTYLFCQENGVPVLPTKLVGEEPPFSFPFVVKSRDGHGGSEVYLIASQEEWDEKKDAFSTRFVAQPLCDEPGKDMRVYALGRKVLASMLRTSKNDFRSNFSLGGTAAIATPTRGQKSIVEKLYDVLAFDFVGIDFIRHKGEWILNEIEDAVGTRMLYKHTEIDAAREYALRINRKLQDK